MEGLFLAMVLSYSPAAPAEIPVITVEQGVEVKAISCTVVVYRQPVRRVVRAVVVVPVRVLVFLRERQPVRNFFRNRQPIRTFFRERQPVRRVLRGLFCGRCR